LSLDHLLNLGIWKRLDTIKNDDLRHKATLIPELLDAAFAGATLKKYRSAWLTWVE